MAGNRGYLSALAGTGCSAYHRGIVVALGETLFRSQQPWPKVDEEAAMDEEIALVIQINGKVRDKIMVPVGISSADAEKAALASESVQKHLEGQTPKKVIVVQGRLVNIVL